MSPNSMGLIGANNPIYQASQGMMEQSGQARNVAAQGIVNERLQKMSKQTAAQMEAASQMAQAKDPVLRKMGLQTLIQLGGKEPNPDIDQRLDEGSMAASDLAKLSKTLKDPEAFKQAYNSFLTRFGSDYVGEEQAKMYEGNLKQMESTRQGEIQAQALGISPDDPNYAAMIQGDEKTRGVLIDKLKPKDGDATASLREFETVNGIRPEFRGTPQYKKMYEDWLKVKNPGAGSGQVVIMPTAEGFAAINKKTGTATPIIGAGGESVNKPLTGEMITTQQQIGTVQDVFERIKSFYKEGYTGPAQGRLGSIKSVTVGNKPEQAQFISDLQDLNNTLVYLKSGKQINEQEYERLKAAMPHLNLADSDFKARMGAFEKTLNSIITERQKNMGGYGKAQSAPQRRATDTGGVRRYNPATGRIE